MTESTDQIKKDREPVIPYKVIGLIATVIGTLGIFVGAVSWVSINMADNAITIEALQKDHARYEFLISKNGEIIAQHSQVLAIIKRQGDQLKVLNDFMIKGGRFTEKDGRKLHEQLAKVKDRLQHYVVLETELGWIKKSISDLEREIAKNFGTLTNSVNIIADKQDRVYEGHMGEFHKDGPRR